MTACIASIFICQTLSLDIRNFGARSDGSDATRGVQRALNEAKRLGGGKVFVPKGTFLVKNLTVYSKTKLYGEGSESILRRKPKSLYQMITINPLSSVSMQDNKNVTDVQIRDLTLRDNCMTEAFNQQYHLVKANGVDRLVVSNVNFVGFRGDGLYLGAGDASTVIRFNHDVTVENCQFDGLNWNNRNAISVTDGTGITISGCSFTRMTNSVSPGGIDFEMNKDGGHIIQNVKVMNNTFESCGGSAIIFDIPSGYADLGKQMNSVQVFGNHINNQARRGILVNQWTLMDYSAPRQYVVIRDNQISNTDLPIAIEGTRGVTIQGNTITDCAQGIHVGYGPLGHGSLETVVDSNVFRNVGFTDLGNMGSAVILFNVDRATVSNNTTNDVASSVVLFRNARGGGVGKNVTISGNLFENRKPGANSYRVITDYQLDLATFKNLD